MTSASNPPPVLDADRIDATAERIATDWGHHGHNTITAIITELAAAAREVFSEDVDWFHDDDHGEHPDI